MISPKGQKVHNYPLKLKITATKYAEIHDSRAAERNLVLTEKEYKNGERIKTKS